jgi:hypothetical protein
MHIFAKIKKAQLTVKAPLVVILCLMLSIAGDVFLSYRVQEKELVETKRSVLKDIM